MALVAQLRVELHCHTIHSYDGHIEFDGLVRAAKGQLDVWCASPIMTPSKVRSNFGGEVQRAALISKSSSGKNERWRMAAT